MKIKMVEQKVVLFVTIVAFLTFVTLQSNKANSHTSAFAVHTKLKLCHFGHLCKNEVMFSCQESFVPVAHS